MTEKLEAPSTEFDEAVRHHQLTLAMFGENDPRTIDGIHLVMLLAPDWLFAEMEAIANAPRH